MSASERRRRVLIGAYACGPGMGSEPGAGWAMVEAAAAHADVWVITRHRFASAIEAALLKNAVLASRVHVEYLDLPQRQLRFKRRHRDVYWYYPLWQRLLAQRALQLHRTFEFDVLHHATFAVDWMPCGLRSLAAEVPLVWGPVGGSTYVPARMLPWLGIRGAVHEIVRSATTRALRRMVADPVARRSALIVALNHDVRDRFARYGEVVVEQNAVIDDWGEMPRVERERPETFTAVFVGRLVAWKGVRLALAALAHPDAIAWQLEFIGSGPEALWLRRQIKRLGLESRVRLRGQLSREEVKSALIGADAFLFPSLHDSAPWAVAEATAAGLPVVCVDLGGPPEMARRNGYVVAATYGAAESLARGLKRQESEERPARDKGWAPDRFPALLQSWYDRAVDSRAAAARLPSDAMEKSR